jgi:hypothetical protein
MKMFYAHTATEEASEREREAEENATPEMLQIVCVAFSLW